jgi:hypothetical protein
MIFYAVVKIREVDTGATPLAIPVITHPLEAVYTIDKLSPTSVNVTEAPPLRIAGVTTQTASATSKTIVTICPTAPAAGAGVVEVVAAVTSTRPPVNVTAVDADVYG